MSEESKDERNYEDNSQKMEAALDAQLKQEARAGSAQAPCSVERTSRSVIEGKLLTALNGDSQVAILATKQDLEDLIAALGDYELTKCLPRWKAHRERCKNLCDGMRQLLREAFPP